MILTCPECATSYFVDDGKIPANGRSVRCANCGTRWSAQPDTELELSSTPDEGAIAREPASPPGDEVTSVEALPGEALPKVFRAKADSERKVRQAATLGVVWAATAAALLILAALSIVFRADIVRQWPRSAAAYATIGMPVNSLGLALEGVRAVPALKDGHATLAITGQIRNIQDREAVSPPLRINLLDKSGKAVASQTARPADPRIPPGEIRHFAFSVIDPPSSAHDLEVTFANLPPPKPAATPKGHSTAHAIAHPASPHEKPVAAPVERPVEQPADAGLRPAMSPATRAPVEAKPLPPESPYALPSK